MPWFGPPMSPPRWRPRGSWRPGRTRSTCYEALGVEPEPTDRIRHVAHLGVRTRDFAFAVHGLERAGRGVPRRAHRARPASLDLGAGGRRADGDRARRTTSACWSPSAGTATTSTSSPTAPTPTAGSTSPRPSPARPGDGTGGRPAAEARCRDRQLLRLLRRPALGDARDARGRRRARLDVLTGDYLAELTMLILGRDPLKDPSLGYARTFVRQVEDCLGLALERGVRIVANAGGLNPAGLADEAARGRRAGSASTPRSPTSTATTSRARRRARLDGRADRQRLPRRASASPRRCAAAPTSWSPAGSPTPRWSSARRSRTSAGRPRRTTSWPAPSSPATSSSAAPRPPAATSPASATCPHGGRPLGFPIAEIAADGSCVITKHAGTGGAVTVDTVTAQLVYEIQSTALPRPRRHHAPRHHRSSTRTGPDRVAVTGVRGQAAAASSSRSASTSSAASATQSSSCSPGSTSRRRRRWVRAQLEAARLHRGVGRPGRSAPRADRRTPTPRRAPRCLLRCTVKDPRPSRSARRSPAPRSSWRWRRTRASR